MVAKRALVVDDSRSARAFLAKLLEEQQIHVDAAETAEQAIDYLTQHRPDVIFMDHLMPGMDGFQAVQAIKANPRTAGIPILMYTSQEGELYLGQARALGAAGVVQKNMAPPDVRALLQELELVPGAPRASVPEAAPVLESDASKESPMPTSPGSPVQSTDAGTVQVLAALDPAACEQLQEEMAAMRRELADTLRAHGEQMTREVRSLVHSVMPAPAPMVSMQPEKPRHSPWAWLLALAASVAAAVLGTLWWQQQQLLDAARSELMDSKSTVALLTARLAPAATVDGVVLAVPFGEAPLDGARVDALRDFVARIALLDQPGRIEVSHFAGRFCLGGGDAAGAVLADPALITTACTAIASDPAAASVESAGFAAAAAELRQKHPALTIEMIAATGEAAGRAYPEADGTSVPTAGEWNAVAAANNRVEIRWHPAP